VNIKNLQAFEKTIAEYFEAGNIRCPIHLSGGNEKQLLNIFSRIGKSDYVFSTHRNHYHYLLHTRDFDGLAEKILVGNDSMHTCDPKNNFYSSSIVAGCVAIAAGVAWALRNKRSKQKVWCFVGDAVVDEGWFWEALRYAEAQDLPVTYIVEDNDRSVVATKKQRWGSKHGSVRVIAGSKHLIAYQYKCKYPHCGIGKWVTF
jgi:TPP-dependent pyruvate/acetoin dehydrogenase alpha subunit